MKTVYLHFGYPKTATTTLQTWVFPYIKDVQYLGKFYKDKIGGYHTSDLWRIIQALMFMDKKEFDINLNLIKDKFQQTLTETEKNKILFSEEGVLVRNIKKTFSNFPCLFDIYEFSDRLKRLSENTQFKLKFIFTIRNQTNFIYSRYMEEMLQEDINSLFPKDIFDNRMRFFEILKYHSVIGHFEKNFGKGSILVIPTELLKTEKKLYFDKLSNFLGSPIELVEKLPIENKKSSVNGYKKFRNNSFTLNLYRFIASNIPRNIRKELKRSQSITKAKEMILFSSQEIAISPENLTWIRSQYGTENELLSRKIGINLKSLGYPYP